MKFGVRGQLTDIITLVKLLVDRFRGYGVLTPQKLPFPVDLLRRPSTVYAVRTAVRHCDPDPLIIDGLKTKMLFMSSKPLKILEISVRFLRNLLVSSAVSPDFCSLCSLSPCKLLYLNINVSALSEAFQYPCLNTASMHAHNILVLA